MATAVPSQEFDLAHLHRLREMGLHEASKAMEKRFVDEVTTMATRHHIPISGANPPSSDARSIAIVAEKGEVEIRGLNFETARNMTMALTRAVPGAASLKRDESGNGRAFKVTFLAEREVSLKRLIKAANHEFEHRSQAGIPLR